MRRKAPRSGLAALFAAFTAESYEVGVPCVDRLFERGAVHVLANGFFNDRFGDLPKISLGHSLTMPRFENRRKGIGFQIEPLPIQGVS